MQIGEARSDEKSPILSVSFHYPPANGVETCGCAAFSLLKTESENPHNELLLTDHPISKSSKTRARKHGTIETLVTLPIFRASGHFLMRVPRVV